MLGCLGKIALAGIAVGCLVLGGCAAVMGSCTMGVGNAVSNAVSDAVGSVRTGGAVAAFDKGIEAVENADGGR